MTFRILGAVLLVIGSSGFGIVLSQQYQREIGMLRQLQKVLQEMEWELKYRLTPLPDICGIAAESSRGNLQKLFVALQMRLEEGGFAEVSGCMNGLLQTGELPGRCRKCLRALGTGLGRFDLEGQLQGIGQVRQLCCRYLEELEANKPERLRSYRTLALCAGAALAILLV